MDCGVVRVELGGEFDPATASALFALLVGIPLTSWLIAHSVGRLVSLFK
jgi:hypothetical protein